VLAVLGGAGQGVDDRVVDGGPIERLLDRQDLRVVRRLLDELHDRVVRLVRVVDQDVSLADGGEDVGAAGELRRHLRLVRGLLQLAEAVEPAEGDQGGQVDRAGDLVDVAVVEVERGGRLQLREEVLVGAVGDLQPTAAPHFRWRRVSWIVDRRLLRTSVSWIVRSLLRVTRNEAYAATVKPPNSASSRGPMTSSSRTNRRRPSFSSGRRTRRLRTEGTCKTA
jgi:hypothetical protein